MFSCNHYRSYVDVFSFWGKSIILKLHTQQMFYNPQNRFINVFMGQELLWGENNFFHLCQNELRNDMFINPCLITTIKKSMQMCFAISCRLQLKKKKYCWIANLPVRFYFYLILKYNLITWLTLTKMVGNTLLLSFLKVSFS